jgi:hypothetical protein
MSTARSETRWRRVALAVVLGEVLPIVLLVLMVAAHDIVQGPGAQSQKAFALAAGQWVGPAGGALTTFALGYWAGRPVPRLAIVQGLLIGLSVAFLDLAILAVLGASSRAVVAADRSPRAME